ncbi:MAG: hypothetical protein IIC70_13520, partial [Acidobacteria bacterium]|nr:hypothetical protein [Acidobacteriota bacterium]
MTAVSEQVRPVEPPKAVSYAWPLLVGTVAVGATGVLGFVGLLWGLAVAMVTFAIFAWQGLTRAVPDALLLAVGGGAGLTYFDWVLSSRSNQIDLALGINASLGWLVFGLAAGYVVVRNRPGLRLGAVAAQGFAWGGGALVALLTAASMGFIEPLRRAQLAAGEIQALTISRHIAVAVVAAALGLGLA